MEKRLISKPLKRIMIVSCQWIFENNKNLILLSFYKLVSFLVHAVAILYHLIFIITFVCDYECKYHLAELVSTAFRSVGSISITLLLRSKERQQVLDIIRDYESSRLIEETSEAQRIYHKDAKFVNKLLDGTAAFTLLTLLVWWATGAT